MIAEVLFLAGGGKEYILPVDYIALDGVAKYNGDCAFCLGDPCGELSPEDSPIYIYFAENASWADVCPFCQGRPS